MAYYKLFWVVFIRGKIPSVAHMPIFDLKIENGMVICFDRCARLSEMSVLDRTRNGTSYKSEGNNQNVLLTLPISCQICLGKVRKYFIGFYFMVILQQNLQ